MPTSRPSDLPSAEEIDAQVAELAGKFETMYSIEAVAKYLGFSVESVRKRIRADELVAVKKGRTYNVSESALRDFMAKYYGIKPAVRGPSC
jgi:excisionase family DNA binding protein